MGFFLASPRCWRHKNIPGQECWIPLTLNSSLRVEAAWGELGELDTHCHNILVDPQSGLSSIWAWKVCFNIPIAASPSRALVSQWLFSWPSPRRWGGKHLSSSITNNPGIVILKSCLKSSTESLRSYLRMWVLRLTWRVGLLALRKAPHTKLHSSFKYQASVAASS